MEAVAPRRRPRQRRCRPAASRVAKAQHRPGGPPQHRLDGDLTGVTTPHRSSRTARWTLVTRPTTTSRVGVLAGACHQRPRRVTPLPPAARPGGRGAYQAGHHHDHDHQQAVGTHPHPSDPAPSRAQLAPTPSHLQAPSATSYDHPVSRPCHTCPPPAQPARHSRNTLLDRKERSAPMASEFCIPRLNRTCVRVCSAS
jgi:hypothetical protein